MGLHETDTAAFVAGVAVLAATVGWWATSWVSYRNSKIQHTISLTFSRMSQSLFSENVAIFHKNLGYELSPYVGADRMSELRSSSDDEDRKTAQSVVYLLNYFEFIAAAIELGDLDLNYIVKTMNGQIKFYYDKCFPLIYESRKSDPRIMEHLSRLREYLDRN